MAKKLLGRGGGQPSRGWLAAM